VLYSSRFAHTCFLLNFKAKLASLRAAPGEEHSVLSDDGSVESPACNLANPVDCMGQGLLCLGFGKEVEVGGNTDVFFDVQACELAATPHEELLRLCKREGVLMASRKFDDVAEMGVEDRLAHFIGNPFAANAQLAALIVAPGVDLTELVDRQSVCVATADLLDELVFERHAQPRVQHFEALHRPKHLARNEVLQTELSVLVGAPRIELAQNLALLNASHFFAHKTRVGVQERASSRVAVRAGSIGVLAHLVAGKSRGRGF